jgi:small-conductance mechanosensitive channel
VIIDGRTVLTVYQNIGSFTAKDRAEKITERLLTAAKQGVTPESVVLNPQTVWTEISAGGRLILAISEGDAKAAGMPRAQLAAEDAESIRKTLINYHRDHSLRTILRGIGYSLLATIALVPLAFWVRKLRLSIRRRLERWIEIRTMSEHKKTAFEIAGTYVVSMLLAIGTVLRWLLLIALFEVYLTVVLSFFPQTRAVSHAVTGWIVGALKSMGSSALDYVPNLFVVAVIVLVAVQVSKLVRMVFDEIGKGNLSINGFYPEWAEPSAKLIRMLVLVLAIVVVFPYLPGSKSPAFQGISIFVGVLLSLGSSSAVANAIAGIILTYMRSFAVGDWVKIGDTVGEVREKSMLVTRVLTPKHEIITIPNATVMSGSVTNFTREAKNSGVIFHTMVTIGYDAPWKIVHGLLIDAAMATNGVLHSPPPFVLQSQLNDFYVSYELNGYTDAPRRMQFIYSDLHQNIQDRFNEAGVEICSPHFAALRDGNTIAIPAQYISRDYSAPGFQVDVQEKDARRTTASRT